MVITDSDSASGQTDEYDSDCELVGEIMCTSLACSSNFSNQSVCECQCYSEPAIPFYPINASESCVLWY